MRNILFARGEARKGVIYAHERFDHDVSMFYDTLNSPLAVESKKFI